MYIYIDESGDHGMRGKPGSSAYYVVTAVLFKSHNDRNHCSTQISKLKKHLKMPKGSELKFSKLQHKTHIRIFNELAKSRLQYFGIILDKKKLTGIGFKYKRSFRKYPIKLLFSNMRLYLTNATLIIDRFGTKEFQKQLIRYVQKLQQPDDQIRIKKFL